MITINKMLQKAIDTLYEKLKDCDYGSQYDWNQLAKLSGLNPSNKKHIYYVSNKVCLLLMKNDQKYLETVREYGKRIVNPSEHQLIAKKTANKSVRIYRRAGAVLSSTNMEELTEEQRNDVIDAANKYSTLEMFTNEMLKKKKIGLANKNDVKTAGLFLDAIKMFASKKN